MDDILSRIEASHPDGRGFFSLLETAWGSNAQLGIPAHNVRLEALHGMGGTGCWDFGNGTTRCPTIFPGHSPRTPSLFYMEITNVHRKVCRRMVE